MEIQEFGIEKWMLLHEGDCKINFAQTCVEILNIQELLEISGNKQEFIDEVLHIKLCYGDGSVLFKKEIAKLYQSIYQDNITITHGGIGGNSLAFSALVEPGDEVIATSPTYQQHYSLPESLGADVKILDLKPENECLPDLDQLRSFITEKTKLICISNPNNPTGALMNKEFLLEIVKIARESGIFILCDEAYRGLTHEGNSFTESIVDLYEKGISTGSMSKTFSLAGLRIGWVAGQKDIIEMVDKHRDYNTICCSMIDEKIAMLALECKDTIIKRNIELIRKNSKILEEWIAREPMFSYTKPKGGTTIFLKFEFEMTSEEFCTRLLKERGVLLVPGSAMEREGFVRLGYACDTNTLITGLKDISAFLSEVKDESNI